MKHEKRDVLFLCQFFYPEHVSSATLPFDTAQMLREAGFTVDALVGYPKEYYKGDAIPLRQCVKGVGIRRLRYLQLSRGSRGGRLLNFFSFTASVLLHLRTLKRYRSVIVYSNPPILPIAAILAKKLWKTKIVFVAYDVYPEIAYASGSIRPGSLVDRCMKFINRRLYRSADRVVALTDEMRAFLCSARAGLTAERVAVIPNWAHEKTTLPDAQTRKTFGFASDQFVIAFFGNMGICQDMQTILDAAIALNGDERFSFLFVGHGNKTERLREEAARLQLRQVKIYDFLEATAFEKAVASADCFVLSLEKGLKGTCAPSKYYSYLQGGRPIAAVVERDSYLAKEITEERIGAFVENGDSKALCRFLRELAADPEACAEMGENARRLYERSYTLRVAGAAYQTMMHEILNQ